MPVIPTAVAGTFEAWPRGRRLPAAHPTRIHFGEPIRPEDIAGQTSEAVTDLIRQRILDAQRIALRGLAGDLGHREPDDPVEDSAGNG